MSTPAKNLTPMPSRRSAVARASTALIALALAAYGLPVVGAAATPLGQSAKEVLPERSVEAVVVQGSAFPDWSAGPELTVRRPQVGHGYVPPALWRSDCRDEPGNPPDDNSTDHSCNQKPDVAVYGAKDGIPVQRLRGYKWTGSAWKQIPFQVDERFTRYLSNNASGFSFFSGVDQHLTYAFDREGFRFTVDHRSDACLAAPREGLVAEPDPIQGLDDNDELVFMWRNAGTEAPADVAPPEGIGEMRTVRIVDPANPGALRFAYVALAAENGPRPAFDARNGYVRYERDEDADVFHYSQSSYDDYGAAPKGPYYDDTTLDGDPASFTCETSSIRQRRPLDTAWVTTDTYRFRYDGRWMMTELHVRRPDGSFGPDLVDRWKARAFAQDPSSETPCCGYEEEENNWGGSSILLGERTGPVRVIRETWGADSGTNVVRREVFYRDQIQYQVYLRVHVVPPLDGIYAQWDYNAGIMTRYYNPVVRRGVPIDGRRDEVFGNLDDPCNERYDGRGDQSDETYRGLYRSAGLCNQEYHLSMDLPDPTFGAPNVALQWEQISGPHGTLVTRWAAHEVTPGGTAQGLFAVPYYRDDSCFDDGTGDDPGPHLARRSGDEPTTFTHPVNGQVRPRSCWYPGARVPNPAFSPHGDVRFFQGSIATHGLHLLLIADSDNASTTLPITEIDAVQRQVVLRGDPGNVGDRYGRWVEFPLTAVVAPR